MRLSQKVTNRAKSRSPLIILVLIITVTDINNNTSLYLNLSWRIKRLRPVFVYLRLEEAEDWVTSRIRGRQTTDTGVSTECGMWEGVLQPLTTDGSHTTPHLSCNKADGNCYRNLADWFCLDSTITLEAATSWTNLIRIEYGSDRVSSDCNMGEEGGRTRH